MSIININLSYYIIIITLIITHIINVTFCFDAYDCTNNTGKVAMMAINEIKDCSTLIEQAALPRSVNVAIVQKRKYDMITVWTCRVKVSIIPQQCANFFSKNRPTGGITIGEEWEMSDEDCRKAVKDRMMKLPYGDTANLGKAPFSRLFSYDAFGSITRPDKCIKPNVPFVFNGVTYNEHVATGSATVTIDKLQVKRDRANGYIVINNIAYDLSDNSVYDPRIGRIITNDNKINDFTNNYGKIMEVVAKIQYNSDNIPEFIMINESNHIMATIIRKREVHDGYLIYPTMHPDIYIVILSNDNWPQMSDIDGANIDNNIYHDAKQEHLARRLHSYINATYHDVLYQLCRVEREVIANRIALIKSGMKVASDKYIQSRGTLIHRAGHVIYLIECTKVPVKIRHPTSCYDDIPIYYNDSEMFLDVDTNIIKNISTTRICSEIYPLVFQIDGIWYESTPSFKKTRPPNIIAPNTQANIKFDDITKQIENGIYSNKQLLESQNAIFQQVSRSTMINDVINGLAGHISVGSYNVPNLASPEYWNNWLYSKFWFLSHIFMIFGSYMGGFIGMGFAWMLLKAFFEYCSAAHVLHSIYGWSWRLIYAFSNTFTTKAVSKANTRRYHEKMKLKDVENPTSDDDDNESANNGKPKLISKTPVVFQDPFTAANKAKYDNQQSTSNVYPPIHNYNTNNKQKNTSQNNINNNDNKNFNDADSIHIN